jgi:hypothetical protein
MLFAVLIHYEATSGQPAPAPVQAIQGAPAPVRPRTITANASTGSKTVTFS